MKKPDKKKDTDKTFDTRRAAFRAAKRDNGVPVGKQPDEVVKAASEKGKDLKLDNRNRRLYIFQLFLGMFKSKKKKELHIREDKEVFYEDGGHQEKHFNAGDDPSKLKKHYYFKRK